MMPMQLVTDGMEMIQNPKGAKAAIGRFIGHWCQFPSALVRIERYWDWDGTVHRVYFDSAKWTGR